MLDVAHTKVDEADRLWENGAYDLVILMYPLPDGSDLTYVKEYGRPRKCRLCF